jgi:hypothetical protein
MLSRQVRSPQNQQTLQHDTSKGVQNLIMVHILFVWSGMGEATVTLRMKSGKHMPTPLLQFVSPENHLFNIIKLFNHSNMIKNSNS